MPTFTIELQKVIELTGSVRTIADDGVSRLESKNGGIGLDYFKLPGVAGEHEQVVIGKIVDQFYTREIGLETIDMFQLSMRRKASQIQDYYAKLYLSTLMEIDPLLTMKIKSLSTGTSLQKAKGTGENETSTENTQGTRSVSSELPQTMLSGSSDYATAGSDVNSNGQATSTAKEENVSESDTTNDSETETSGYQGSPADLITRYRQALLNVDMMIVDEFTNCFMLIWNNGDNYTNRRFI